MSIEGSIQTLGLLLLAGMGLGLFSSLYGAMRAVWRLGKLFGAVLDWAWWVVAAVYTFLCLVWVDWGVMRLWYVLTMVIGYLLWVAWAAPVVYPVLRKMVWMEARGVYGLMFPVRLAGRLVHWGWGRTFRFRKP